MTALIAVVAVQFTASEILVRAEMPELSLVRVQHILTENMSLAAQGATLGIGESVTFQIGLAWIMTTCYRVPNPVFWKPTHPAL